MEVDRVCMSIEIIRRGDKLMPAVSEFIDAFTEVTQMDGLSEWKDIDRWSQSVSLLVEDTQVMSQATINDDFKDELLDTARTLFRASYEFLATNEMPCDSLLKAYSFLHT